MYSKKLEKSHDAETSTFGAILHQVISYKHTVQECTYDVPGLVFKRNIPYSEKDSFITINPKRVRNKFLIFLFYCWLSLTGKRKEIAKNRLDVTKPYFLNYFLHM